MRLTDLAGKSIAVWGARLEGKAAAQALLRVAPRSLVAVDDDPERDRAAWDDAFGGLVPLHVGPDALELLLAVDVVVKSPGVKPSHPWLDRLHQQNVEVTTGTVLWMTEHGSHTVAVTGTKGKSTTAALIHHLLTALGEDATLTGNIGSPLLETGEKPLHIVELSSYQCADLTTSPRVAVVTSLFPEHLDWHGSEEQYYSDKLNLLAHGPATVVINAQDERLTLRVPRISSTLNLMPSGCAESFNVADGPNRVPYFYFVRTPLFPRHVSPLLGAHNGTNICVALGALRALGIDCVANKDHLGSALRTFQGLPHRLEQIPDRTGLLFVNDSLSTTPQSTVAALNAYSGRPMTLIVGGTDRGLDYHVLRDHFERSQQPANVLAIPDSGPRIAETLQGLRTVHIEILPGLWEAVARSRRLTPPGGIVMMSPAAPSYGRFANFAERSDIFRKAIAETE